MADAAANLAPIVIGAGFACALAFGWVAARTNFCTMGALSDIVNMGHWGRMRMWLLAIAVAIAGTTALAWFGQVDLARAIARRPVLPWLSPRASGLLVRLVLPGSRAGATDARATPPWRWPVVYFAIASFFFAARLPWEIAPGR